MVRLLVASTLALTIYGILGANTTVMVHLAHRTFTNQTVNVGAGDVVQFISLNPTGPFRVIQTMFNAPCRPVQNGFDSGSIYGTAPYTVNVTDLNPIWFYEHGECTEGMVGAINAPTEGNTFDVFQAAALRSQESDQPLPSPSSSSSPETSPTTTPPSASLPLPTTLSSLDESTASRGTGSSIPKSTNVSGPSRIAIKIAVIIGTAALCLVLVVIALLCRRRRHRVRGQGARIAPIPPPPSPSPHRAGKASMGSETEAWRSETEDVRTELAQLRELVVTQLAPPPPQYHDIARVPSI